MIEKTYIKSTKECPMLAICNGISIR